MVESKKRKGSIAEAKGLLHSILASNCKATKFIKVLGEKSQFSDVFFYTWKLLNKALQANKQSNEIFMMNVLDLLEKISPTKGFPSNKDKLTASDLGLKKGSNKFVLDIPSLKKYIRKVWESLVNRDMSPVVHQKLLFVLLEMYLSKMDKPIFLTDFLMSSINVKGIISILALQGVATLMQKHNIEYPNIYVKLYKMFTASIFHAKYKSRLFHLADIFLSSTYLPENLVASFAKRAARLALICAASDTPIIFRFIGNLLLRHPGLIKMIHHPTGAKVADDPFLEEEDDPTKTRATESSLWEISLLKNHCQPSVSGAAKFIDFKLPSVEFDMSEVLNNSYEDMFESEAKKNKQKPSVTFDRPQGSIAKLKSDIVYKLWSLTE